MKDHQKDVEVKRQVKPPRGLNLTRLSWLINDIIFWFATTFKRFISSFKFWGFEKASRPITSVTEVKDDRSHEVGVVSSLLRKNQGVLIVGPRGSGKTAVAKEAAKKAKMMAIEFELKKIKVMSIGTVEFLSYVPGRIRTWYYLKNIWTLRNFSFTVMPFFLTSYLPYAFVTKFWDNNTLQAIIFLLVPFMVFYGVRIVIGAWNFFNLRKIVFILSESNSIGDQEQSINVIWILRKTFPNSLFIIETAGEIDEFIQQKFSLKAVYLKQNNAAISLIDLMREKIEDDIKSSLNPNIDEENDSKKSFKLLAARWSEHERVASFAYDDWLYSFACSLSYRDVSDITNEFHRFFFYFKGELYFPDYFLMFLLHKKHKDFYNFVVTNYGETNSLINSSALLPKAPDEYASFIANFTRSQAKNITGEGLALSIPGARLVAVLAKSEIIYQQGITPRKHSIDYVVEKRNETLSRYRFATESYKLNYLRTTSHDYSVADLLEKFNTSPAQFYKYVIDEKIDLAFSSKWLTLVPDEMCVSHINELSKPEKLKDFSHVFTGAVNSDGHFENAILQVIYDSRHDEEVFFNSLTTQQKLLFAPLHISKTVQGLSSQDEFANKYHLNALDEQIKPSNFYVHSWVKLLDGNRFYFLNNNHASDKYSSYILELVKANNSRLVDRFAPKLHYKSHLQGDISFNMIGVQPLTDKAYAALLSYLKGQDAGVAIYKQYFASIAKENVAKSIATIELVSGSRNAALESWLKTSGVVIKAPVSKS